MNTIKMYLATSGRVADMHKDFPLFQGQFQNKLINVYVPTSILAPQYSAQYYIGQMSGDTMPTDEELDLFVENNTANGREPINGDVIEFTYLGVTPSTYWLYIYNNNEWTSQQVDSLGTTNSLDGTSVQLGMLANKRNGVIYESKKYLMRYLKTLTYQNVEYAMYERKLPKEFTKFVGQGESAPIMVFNVVNIDLQENVITKVITSQTCRLDVMPSTDLDQDPDIEEPSELERISALVDTLNAEMQTKQGKVDSSINTNAIVSTKSVVGAINDISSAVSTNTIDIGNNRADIALLDANKQDKTDNNLETTDKTVVGAINELNTQVGINTINIGTNTYDISALDTRVAHVEDIIGSGEDYIGAMSGTLDPTDLEDFETLSSQLSAFVLTKRPSVEGGDVVIYTQLIEHDTDKNYKFIYSGAKDGWTYYEIPPVEKAGNDTCGIIKGSYDAGNTTTKTQVNIVNGEIKDITMIDSLGQHQDIADYVNTQAGKITTLRTDVNVHTGEIALNAQHIQSNTNAIGTLNTTVGNIIDGTTAVGYAKQAEKDSLNRNIAQTYMTQNLGATKQQLYDYALPRTFNDVSFVGANNQFVDTIPESSSALYTATSTLVGDTQLFYVEKTIDNAYFELANKNSYNDTLYVSASANCTVTFKVTTQVYHNAQWTTLNIELTEPVTFESGVIRRVEFGSTMNSLTDILDIIPEDKIKQTFEVQTSVSTPITFSVYSNETYPSAFYLNTTSQVISISQGSLGELPVHILTGALDNSDIVFTIPSAVEFNNNVNALYILNYSGSVQDNTNVRLERNGVSIKLETPYNYGTNNDAKVADLAQLCVVDTEQSHTWVFTAVTRESAGEKYLVVSEENLTDLSNMVASKVDANTAITGATKTKITYDSKGLVTGGADLQESDIPTLSTSKISGLDAKLQQVDTNTENITSLQNNKVDKISTTSRLYATDLGGNQTSVEYSPNADANKIVQRYAAGQILVPQTPTSANHATSKKYVDDQLALKEDIISATNTINADYVDDTSSTNKFATSAQLAQIGTNTTDISTINGKIPTQATSSNQLADKAFVNSSINAFASFYITKNAQGDPFATKAELTNATTFYSGGAVRVPTTNDYCIVLADESKTSGGVDPSTRYTYQGGTYPNGQWEYQYTINVTPLTSAQLQALNSGITSALVTQIGTNASDIANKQDTLVSGTNIKTINGNSVLGSGDITIQAGQSVDVQVDGTSIVSNDVANLQTINSDYDATTNPLATQNDLSNIDLSTKMDKTNPTGTGSFSLNRRANSTVGVNSFVAGGTNNAAAGDTAHAEGFGTSASGVAAHSEGASTYATGNYSHAEGQYTTAQGTHSHAEGNSTTASGNYSHSEGESTTAAGNSSHSEGVGTIANRKSHHVYGEYNVVDTTGTYASDKGSYVEIVGNGTGTSARSNARTLDWSGNEWLAGSQTAVNGYKIGSSNSTIASVSGTNLTLGNSSLATDIAGSGTRPTYNSQSLALYNDIPSTSGLVSNVSYDSSSKKLQQTKGGTTSDIVTFGANAFNSTTIPTSYVSSVNGSSGAITGVLTTSSGLPYTTTAPSSANTDGIKIAVLSSEPATKYSGWLYFITE